jgi:hypothetical protein
MTSRITGTATATRFAYYQLLRPADTTGANPPWTEITRGLSPVTAGPLGTIDPSTLPNGEYQLGLRVVDVNGQLHIMRGSRHCSQFLQRTIRIDGWGRGTRWLSST